MSTWTERMRVAVASAALTANSAGSADRSFELPIGANGAIGTTAGIASRRSDAELLALPALTAQSRLLPCPADVAERAALIAEGDQCSRDAAGRKALAEFGFATWQEFADGHRIGILGKLAELNGHSSEPGRRLILETKKFIGSNHWQCVVSKGWPLIEVFGLNPSARVARVDGQGLVTGIALSSLIGGRVVEIADDHAVVECRSGSRLIYQCGKVGLELAKPWWECTTIHGGL